MIKRSCKTLKGFTITMFSVVIAIFSHLHIGKGKELKNTSFSSSEHSHTESNGSDNHGIMHNKVASVPTGTLAENVFSLNKLSSHLF